MFSNLKKLASMLVAIGMSFANPGRVGKCGLGLVVGLLLANPANAQPYKQKHEQQTALTAHLKKTHSTLKKEIWASLPGVTDPADILGETRAPMGWSGFCRENPNQCALDTSEPAFVELTKDVWHAIQSVNRSINTSIKPVSDMEQWGVAEHWDIPTTGKGDCEDYALLKRKQLSELGLPRRALLMTVVIDETGGGHAILTVRTDRGDLILDNKRSSVLPWEETGYRFVKRESQTAQTWVSMSDRSAIITAGN